MIDVEQVLRKYLVHVISEEGTTFVDTLSFPRSPYRHRMTDEEIHFIEDLDEQRRAEEESHARLSSD